MELTSRDHLRRAVRRAVHHACWQRLEGDHEHIRADPSVEIAEARSSHPTVEISDDEVAQWIAEDEAEFDRAILISDLVARRVQRTAAAPDPAPAPKPVAVPLRMEPVIAPAAEAREILVRTPTRTAPSITALLDDMLAQRRAANGPGTNS